MLKDFDRKKRFHASLETLLASVKRRPGQEHVGGVVVHPNCETELDESEESELLRQFKDRVGEEKPDPRSLKSPQGLEISVSAGYPLVRKYLKRIVMYGDAGMGSWVQVLDP